MREEPRLLSGWGRTPVSLAHVVRPGAVADAAALLADAGGRGVLVRGLGRSYGDAALNAGGRVIDATCLDRIESLDLERGRATVQAGVSLDALMRALVPLGWFPPVVPGTAFVTVGGAIAADVHGKNHHRDGSFGAHVEAIDLVTPDGRTVHLTPETGVDLYRATVGGMGLTGLIVRATLRLRPVESAYVRMRERRASDIDATMRLLQEADAVAPYSVAWVDGAARGAQLGRSVVLTGDHARADEAPRTSGGPRRRVEVPGWWPRGLVASRVVSASNRLRYRAAPRTGRERLVELSTFFHPLDAIGSWNHVYGSRGFVQYQFAVPERAASVVPQVLADVRHAGLVSPLVVLKRFGSPSGGGFLSFPLAGWTLTLDFAAGVQGLSALLHRLDETVVEAGGRVYLAKDARLRPELLAAMYPELDDFLQVREDVDPSAVMRSDLGRRLGLVA